MVNPDRNLYEPPYDDALLYDTEAEPERPRSRSLIVMLGFVVVAAFAGVVWVAYNQGVMQGQRDRNPPVLAGDPGPYQVAAEKVAENDALAVAPEKSYDELWDAETGEPGVTSTDPAPGVDRSAPTTQEVVEDGGIGGPVRAEPIDPRMDATVEVAGPSSASTSVSSAPAIKTAVAAPVVRDATTAPVAVAAPAPAPVAPAPAAPRSIVRAEPPAPALQPEAEVAVAEAAPVAASSNVSIQLGAFPSSDAAAAQWSRIKGQNQGLLGPYSPKFMSVEVPGKGTLYRLRVVGFPDKSTAKSVCDQLVAGGGACILTGK